jgi:hypothetical protein
MYHGLARRFLLPSSVSGCGRSIAAVGWADLLFRLEGRVMGRGVYGRCYVRDGVDTGQPLATILAIRGQSLLVPMTENIGVLTDELARFVPPLTGYTPLAVCRAKISVSVNPTFAIALFVVRMKALSRRLGPDVQIVIEEDFDDPANLTEITTLQIAYTFVLSVVEAPLHLLLWFVRYF